MRVPLCKSVPLAFLVMVCTVPAGAWQNQAPAPGFVTKRVGTVKMDLRDNRVFIKLTAVRPDGTTRDARFWVDTGGGAVILSESLVSQLGLKPRGPTKRKDKQVYQAVDPPKIKIDGMPLDFTSVPVLAVTDSKTDTTPGSGAEGILPGRLLKKYQAVFDYPARTFTLAQPGTLEPHGTPVHSPIQPDTGFPRIELTIGGQQYGFLLDTGAAYTTISQALIDKILAVNPNWPHSMGAVGAANMVGRKFDVNVELLRIPSLQ